MSMVPGIFTAGLVVLSCGIPSRPSPSPSAWSAAVPIERAEREVAKRERSCAALQGQDDGPHRNYIHRVTISVNQLLNGLTGGDPDETLSSRWGRARRERGGHFAKMACGILDHFDPCHCDTSIEFLPDGTPRPHHLRGEGKF